MVKQYVKNTVAWRAFDIKTMKQWQLLIRRWCAPNVSRLLMQVHITVVLNYYLRYMCRRRLNDWNLPRSMPCIRGKAAAYNCSMPEMKARSILHLLVPPMSDSLFRLCLENVCCWVGITLSTHAPSLSYHKASDALAPSDRLWQLTLPC